MIDNSQRLKNERKQISELKKANEEMKEAMHKLSEEMREEKRKRLLADELRKRPLFIQDIIRNFSVIKMQLHSKVKIYKSHFRL